MWCTHQSTFGTCKISNATFYNAFQHVYGTACAKEGDDSCACHVQVNLRERQGFIIHPFTVPISTSAAQLSVEHEGFLVEPAFDFKQRAGYISVAKDHRNKYALRGSYAFREVCPGPAICALTRRSIPVPQLCLSPSPHSALLLLTEVSAWMLQETALFEVGYKNHSLFDRNPLIKVCHSTER